MRVKVTKNLKENVDNFICENKDLWYSKLDKQKDVMFKMLCHKQVLLYNKCLEEEPVYIPRKFRNNKVYTMKDQEKNIYNKLALEKINTEMETQPNRLEHFRNSIETIEKEIKQFLDKKNIPEILKIE